MDYIYRNTKPKPLPTPAPKKIVSPAGQRLSVIMENNNNNNNSSTVHPALRQHRFPSISNISLGRRSNRSTTTIEKEPPRYSTIYADGNARTDEEIAQEGPGGLKGQLKRRGGWMRVIACLIILVIVIAVALGVGLGVGLTQGGSSNSSSSPLPTQTPNPFQPPQAFPLGSYTIQTNLQSSSAACTSNSDTWTCPPDDVTWTISNQTDGALRILSTNPFAAFGPVALTRKHNGTADEQYTFSTVLVRPVILGTSLSGNNVRTTCFYNATTFSGALYARKARTYPSFSNSTASLNGGVAGEDWPFAVSFSYTAAGGPNVPNCYELVNGHVGSRVTTGLSPQSSTADCSCAYQNWG